MKMSGLDERVVEIPESVCRLKLRFELSGRECRQDFSVSPCEIRRRIVFGPRQPGTQGSVHTTKGRGPEHKRAQERYLKLCLEFNPRKITFKC